MLDLFPITAIAGTSLLAGTASRQVIGTEVVGGMIAATIMSLTFTPVFYVVMQRLSELRGGSKTGENTPVTETSADTA